jgi:hypothetical protein
MRLIQALASRIETDCNRTERLALRLIQALASRIETD